MWNQIHSSVTGTSHLKVGADCQDYCNFRPISVAGKPGLCIGIADGAGSAAHSFIGASMAVEYALSRIEPNYEAWDRLAEAPMTSLLADSIAYLADMALQQNLAVRDFACTFLLGIFTAETGVFAQIGDGCWVVGNEETIASPTWPSSGEYANETTFLTSTDALSSMQLCTIHQTIDYVAGFTDGLQNLLLDFGSHKPFDGFFNPFLDSVRSAPNKAALCDQLGQFLGSDRVCSRTDDDKTFAFAWRDV
jgi:hypothetical protein